MFQSPHYLSAMLSSAACALKRTRVPRTSSWGLNKAVKSRRQVVKPFPSKTASSATRSYALMKHTDPYIAADYESYALISSELHYDRF